MEPGKLRHKVTIQSRQELRDASGQPKPVFTTFATAWGEMRPARGREYQQAQLVQSDLSVTWVIRYVSGVTPRHRLIFGARIFDINSCVDVGGRQETLELMCTEKI